MSKQIDGFYVYKYVNKDGAIVYIGKSKTIAQRIKQHSSYKGIDEKFKKYKNADIYLHRCNTEHEMDALEIILIERYKPELNVSAKTNNVLSFAFEPELEWIKYDKLKTTVSKKKAKKEISSGIMIKSEKGVQKFLDLIHDWHTLYYFINWLIDQKPNDERVTITFDKNNELETGKWIWEYKHGYRKNNPLDAIGIDFPYCSTGHALITRVTSKQAKVWIDLNRPVYMLKRLIPVLSHDLMNIELEIMEYIGISDNYIDNCKENGFLDFFTEVRFNTSFPQISDCAMLDENKRDEIIKEVFDNEMRIKHTSPKLPKPNPDEIFKMLFGAHESKCYIPGGAYWNLFLAEVAT